MTVVDKLNLVARTDSTFSLSGRTWVGKCLICNGPMAFDAVTGEGATLEHIRARSRGGGENARNLGIVHASCNWDKGRRWDRKGRRSAQEYEELVARMLARRQQRWREESQKSEV
jgi:5-methylcytosine-specific restriction endonuclease McrA